MLSKLIKHEFTHWVRTFMVFYIIYGILAALTKILRTVKIAYSLDGHDYSFLNFMIWIFGCALLMYSIMLPWISVIHNVNRFKKNMFSDEGYLSNTLPVTPAEHIAAKFIMGSISYIVSALLIVLCCYVMIARTDCGCIINVDGTLIDVCKLLSQNFGQAILIFILSYNIFAGIMLFNYLAEGVVAINGGKKFIPTGIAIICFIAAMMISGLISANNCLTEDSVQRTIVQIIFYLLADAGMFFLLSHILKNKLNLE